MAVLRLVPDLPHADAAPEVRFLPDVQEFQHPTEQAIDPPAATAVIAPPKADAAVLIPFLRVAADLAMRVTGASGCAVAMRAGSGFRCYASVGDAPEENAPVRLAGTLTGVCLRKGKVVRCDDTSTDDEGTGYAGAAGSVILAPVYQHQNVCGVVGVFASEPHWFVDEHVAALEQVAGVIGVALLCPERLTSTSDFSPVGTPKEPISASREILTDHTRAMEGLARAINSAMLQPQRLAPSVSDHPLESDIPQGGAKGASSGRKRLYGLPCGGCGAYFHSDLPECPVCGVARG